MSRTSQCTLLVAAALLLLPLTSRAQEPPGRTDRYGDPLPKGALARLGTVRFRHGEPVTYLAFAPDGATLLSATADDYHWPNTVHLWDAATGKERRQVSFGKQTVDATPFRRDGKSVVVRGPDSVLELYDVVAGRRLRGLTKFPDNSAFAISPDKKFLAVLTQAGTLSLWDASADREIAQLAGSVVRQDVPGDHVSHHYLAFSADGKLLALASEKSPIRLWDLPSCQERRPLPGPLGRVWLLGFSPDAKLLMVGANGAPVVLLDVPTGKRVLEIPTRQPASARFSADGKLLAIGDGDDIFLFEVATGKMLRRLPGGGWPCAAFSPDGRVVAVGGANRRIRLWEVATGREVRPTGGADAAVAAVACAPDGKTLATAGGDGRLRLWEATTGKELGSALLPALAAPQGPWYYADPPIVVFVGDSKLLAVARPGGTLYFWQRGPHKPLRPVARPEGHRPAAFSRDGRLILTTGLSGAVGLWETESGAAVRWFAPPKEWEKYQGQEDFGASGLALSRDGRLVAAAWVGQVGALNRIPQVRIWDLASGRLRRFMLFDRAAGALPIDVTPMVAVAPVAPLVFSPDGRMLAIGMRGVIHLWDLAGNRELRRLDCGKAPGGSGVAFSPDSRLLALGQRGAFVLSDVATGAEKCRVSGLGGAITSVAFSPDGRRLITGSADTTALVWDVPALLAEARAEAALSAPRLKALWDDLGGADGQRADRAMWALAAAPRQAVPFLRERLRPVAAVDDDRIGRLVADLGSARFPVRERATKSLEQLGDLASPALRRVLGGKAPLELRRRAEALLGKAEGVVTDPNKMQQLLAVEALERIGTPEARAILTSLATGAPGARLTREAQAALGRLAQKPAP